MNKLKILLFSAVLFCMPMFSSVASASWITGIIPGIDVWNVDSVAGDHATVTSTCSALEPGAFLPNKTQLLDMYTNKASLGSFGDVDYWTSSSFDVNNAHRVDFLNGSTDYGLKSLTEDVRCVRSTPYDYDSTEVTAVGTELSDMLTVYFPAILLIFATLFALGIFYRLARKWIGKRG